MSFNKNRITVFEHESIKPGENTAFKNHHLESLQRYFGEKGTKYYSLINNGVKFNQYVGVLQVGKLVIEVLPKTDKSNDTDWRKFLIGLLRAVGTVKVSSSGKTELKIRSNSILDLYFEMFVTEVEQLVHKGLIKQYRKIEANHSSLKGSMNFPKQIQKNIIHKERFYINHSVYSWDNKFNQILLKALQLIKIQNTSQELQSRIGALLLNFPENSEIIINETTFKRLIFNRKTESYREAIDLAALILLNYHPDLSKGQYNVLAIMFDMNVLWEKFILISLRKNAPDNTLIKGKVKRPFWLDESKLQVGMEPDIVIEKGDDTYILDTKWKVLQGSRPSDDDLKQMYVYTKYFKSRFTALVYPDDGIKTRKGAFFHEVQNIHPYPCSVIKLEISENTTSISAWQKIISQELFDKIMN